MSGQVAGHQTCSRHLYLFLQPGTAESLVFKGNHAGPDVNNSQETRVALHSRPPLDQS
jgi:hypothetical protein